MAATITPDEQRQIDDFLKNGIKIPPRPEVLMEIEKLVNRPGNNAGAVAKLITKDPGLSAAVFKLVNSPFFGLRRPVDDIGQAIVILGITQLTNVVKAFVLRQAIGGNEAAYQKFWDRSHDIATLSSIIAAKQLSACNISPDQAYMAGLFHECGVPILMQRFPEYCKAFRLGEGQNWPDFREEDRRFNTDHTVVGYLVAKYWHLPDFICQAVRYHHDHLHTEHAALTMVSILQLARHVHHRLAGVTDVQWHLFKDLVLDELGLSEEGLVEYEEDVQEIFRQQIA